MSAAERFPMVGDGRCVGAEEALRIFSAYQPESGEASERFECALNRFRYLANRVEPAPPKFHKGQHGHKYDNYTCGDCGATVVVSNRFCPNCGRAIKWRT